MQYREVNWNKKTYQTFQNDLFSFQDIPYRDFHEKLIQSDTLIGVRTPILKKMAKEIVKGDYQSFLQFQPFYYEEKLLQGLVITYQKENIEKTVSYLEAFFSYNDNWAINDITCASLKRIKKEREDWLSYIEKWLQDQNVFTVRFAYVLLLDYYVEEKYLNYIFDMCSKYQRGDYYIQMAIAWLLSICYIHYPKETYAYLKKDNLDIFTHNKTIQKIRESYRVSKEEKNKLQNLKK